MNLKDLYKIAQSNKPVGMIGKGILSLAGGYTLSPAMRYLNQKRYTRTGETPGALRSFIANNPGLTSLGLFTGWQGASEIGKKGLKNTLNYFK